jgi:nucleoside-diphosphate-sugar epimerase
MRVLVTGHTGYIGAVMVPVLMDAGHEVVGLDTGFYRDCGFDVPLAPIREIRKDIREVTAGDLVGFDAVAHLAALCNDPLGDIDPGLTMDINFHGSVRLARAARDAGVGRFLFASSCSMYGAGRGDDALTEDAPLAPITPYAESKVRVEEALHELADRDFSPVYLRNATAYGWSPRLRGDVVLNNLVGWAVTTGKVKILSDGMPWRPIVHVEDISRAFAACLEAPRPAIHNRAWNIGVNEENYRVRDIARMVGEAVPGSEVEVGNQSNPDPRSYRVDFSKVARELPQFKPIWNARAGAVQIYRALKEAGTDRETFFGPRFVRLAEIKRLIEGGDLDTSLRWAREAVAA